MHVGERGTPRAHERYGRSGAIARSANLSVERVDRALADDGTEFVLLRRNGTFQIRADGRELMTSEHHASEGDLARLALRYMARSTSPRVLIGGLGMGFTLRAALDRLPADGHVTVVEACAAVIAWNEGPLAHLARWPLADPRVEVERDTVQRVLARSPDRFDAVLLDVDNGPDDLSLPANRSLYEPAGLAVACAALTPGGVLAIWSAQPAPDLVERLLQIGVPAWSETVVPLPGDTRIQHTIVVAARPEGTSLHDRD